MNTKTIASLIVVASLSVVSCKKELQPQESTTDTTAVATSDATPATVTPTPVTPSQPQTTQTVQLDPSQMKTVPQPAPVSKSATTAKGMNPPHGQPGHRCDIAVGAPLNSPPGKTPQPQTIQPNASATVQKAVPAAGAPLGVAPPAASTPVVTAPGMNPPHGQAGHDCAVAVGAPLPKK